MKNKLALILFCISLGYNCISLAMQATAQQRTVWRERIEEANTNLNDLQPLTETFNEFNAEEQQDIINEIDDIIDSLDEIKEAALVYSAKTCNRCARLIEVANMLINNLVQPRPAPICARRLFS